MREEVEEERGERGEERSEKYKEVSGRRGQMMKRRLMGEQCVCVTEGTTGRGGTG